MTAKPTYWTALNIEEGASIQKITAAYRKLAKDLHPDVAPERAAEFALVTAAYNALKADPLHVFKTKADFAWRRDFIAATKPATKPRRKVEDGFVFEDIEGESKEDRRRRYARTRQQYRYHNEPDFAAARKESSLKSHKKLAEARKAAKAAAAATSAPAAA